MKIEFQYLPT